MKEVPEFEKYPVSEEEMGKRYKKLTEAVARQAALLYNVGKEVGGEKFVERLKEEYFKIGENLAGLIKEKSGAKEEDFKDCLVGLPMVCDYIDDANANFWDGYIENTANAFEKELKTCPLVGPWSEAPEICEILLAEFVRGVGNKLNPKFKTSGFSKLLVKGDSVCRYRIELGN